MIADTYIVNSIWDIDYLGPADGLYFAKDVSEAIEQIPAGKIILFTCDFSMYSHDTLVFLEHYAPYGIIKGDVQSINNEQGQFAYLRVKEGKGVLRFCNHTATERKSLVCYPCPPVNAICDTLQGLDFLARHGARLIVARMEFLQLLNDGNVKLFLERACQQFQSVSIRVSIDPGTLEPKDDLAWGAAKQLAIINDFWERFRNVSLVIPYARSEVEICNSADAFGSIFGGEIIPMIETPLMLYRFKEYAGRFNTYIIGIGDLYSLLEGSGRDKIRYVPLLEDFATSIFQQYVVPYSRENHLFYITSENLTKKIVEATGHQNSISYLAKY